MRETYTWELQAKRKTWYNSHYIVKNLIPYVVIMHISWNDQVMRDLLICYYDDWNYCNEYSNNSMLISFSSFVAYKLSCSKIICNFIWRKAISGKLMIYELSLFVYKCYHGHNSVIFSIIIINWYSNRVPIKIGGYWISQQYGRNYDARRNESTNGFERISPISSTIKT